MKKKTMATQRPMRTIVMAVAAACCSMSAQAQNASLGNDVEADKKAVQQVEISGRFEGEIASAKSGVALRDVPMTLSIVAADVLQEQGALTLDAAIKNVSGLTQSSTNNYGYFNNYLARGLQVNFLRDGLPDGPAVNGYVRTLTDVQQIEVLKGPGSALYGSGAPGGFLNLVGKKPENQAAQSVDFGLGSFNERHLKLDLTGPLASGSSSDQTSSSAPIKYRLISSYLDTDGYRGYGNKTIELLPSFVFASGAGQVTSLDFRHLDSTIHNDSVGMPFRNHMILDVPQENRYYTPFSQSVSKIDSVSLKHVAQINEEWTLRAALAYGKRDLDFLRNVPSWRLNDPVTGTQIVNRTWRDQQDRLHDSNAQFESVWRTASHEVMAGVAWSQTDGTAMRKQALIAPIANIFAPVLPETSNAALDEVLAWKRDVKSAQSGIYLQDQMALSKEWKMRASIRYDRYSIDDAGDYNSLFDAGGAFLSTLADNKQSFVSKPAQIKHEIASVSSGKLNSSLGAVYQASAETSFYVGVAGGSFSNFTTEMGRTAFAPETSRQWEIGNRSVFLNGLVSSNIAFYDTRRFDFFQTANGLSGTLGSSQTRGVDVELMARPMQGWKLRLAYAYQDAELTKYVNVVTKVNDAAVIGKQVPGTSKNQLSLWSSYDLQAPALKGFGFGGGLSYRDAFYADASNTNQAPGKVVLDLLAYYRTQQFEVQANIGNASNARWYRYATGDGGVAPGDTRSLNLSARFKF